MEKIFICSKKTKRIKDEKRKNMGFISKESKKKLNDTSINPKTNLPIKKSCYDCENIIKKIIRIIIRQLNKLLNNNINDKERYYNLSNVLAIKSNNNCIFQNNKDNEVFKQLEENNINNSITNVTVNDYEKIKNMTIHDIFKILNVSKIYKNYFPFHNNILLNLMIKDKNEEKINKLLNITFSQFLLFYQYSFLFHIQNTNDFIYSQNIIYYNNKIEKIPKDKYFEIINLRRELNNINFKGINTLFDTIIKFQNEKNDDGGRKYKDEYINKYIDITLDFHDFFLKKKRRRFSHK